MADGVIKFILEVISGKLTNRQLANLTALAGIVGFLLTLVFGEQVFQSGIIIKLRDKSLSAHQLALVIACIVLPILWVVAFTLERHWAAEKYGKYFPAPPEMNFITSIFIGFMLAILLITSTDIELATGVYTLYIFIDFFGQVTLSYTVRRAIENLPERFANENHIKISYVRKFYTGRQWMHLFVLRIIMHFCVLYVTYFDSHWIYPEYALCISMFVNEVFVWFWRLRLYRAHDFYMPFQRQ